MRTTDTLDSYVNTLFKDIVAEFLLDGGSAYCIVGVVVSELGFCPSIAGNRAEFYSVPLP